MGMDGGSGDDFPRAVDIPFRKVGTRIIDWNVMAAMPRVQPVDHTNNGDIAMTSLPIGPGNPA